MPVKYSHKIVINSKQPEKEGLDSNSIYLYREKRGKTVTWRIVSKDRESERICDLAVINMLNEQVKGEDKKLQPITVDDKKRETIEVELRKNGSIPLYQRHFMPRVFDSFMAAIESEENSLQKITGSILKQQNGSANNSAVSNNDANKVANNYLIQIDQYLFGNPAAQQLFINAIRTKIIHCNHQKDNKSSSSSSSSSDKVVATHNGSPLLNALLHSASAIPDKILSLLVDAIVFPEENLEVIKAIILEIINNRHADTKFGNSKFKILCAFLSNPTLAKLLAKNTSNNAGENFVQEVLNAFLPKEACNDNSYYRDFFEKIVKDNLQYNFPLEVLTHLVAIYEDRLKGDKSSSTHKSNYWNNHALLACRIIDTESSKKENLLNNVSSNNEVGERVKRINTIYDLYFEEKLNLLRKKLQSKAFDPGFINKLISNLEQLKAAINEREAGIWSKSVIDDLSDAVNEHSDSDINKAKKKVIKLFKHYDNCAELLEKVIDYVEKSNSSCKKSNIVNIIDNHFTAPKFKWSKTAKIAFAVGVGFAVAAIIIGSLFLAGIPAITVAVTAAVGGVSGLVSVSSFIPSIKTGLKKFWSWILSRRQKKARAGVLKAATKIEKCHNNKEIKTENRNNQQSTVCGTKDVMGALGITANSPKIDRVDKNLDGVKGKGKGKVKEDVCEHEIKCSKCDTRFVPTSQ